MRITKSDKVAAAVAIVFVAVIAVLAPVTDEATGKKEVRQESVCTSFYYAGARGVSNRICNGYKTVPVTYCEYKAHNMITSWTGFGGCL